MTRTGALFYLIYSPVGRRLRPALRTSEWTLPSKSSKSLYWGDSGKSFKGNDISLSVRYTQEANPLVGAITTQGGLRTMGLSKKCLNQVHNCYRKSISILDLFLQGQTDQSYPSTVSRKNMRSSLCSFVSMYSNQVHMDRVMPLIFS